MLRYLVKHICSLPAESLNTVLDIGQLIPYIPCDTGNVLLATGKPLSLVRLYCIVDFKFLSA